MSVGEWWIGKKNLRLAPQAELTPQLRFFSTESEFSPCVAGETTANLTVSSPPANTPAFTAPLSQCRIASAGGERKWEENKGLVVEKVVTFNPLHHETSIL